MKFISRSPEETKKIANEIAKKYKKRSGVIALSGELGAGKTTFASGFAEGLGIKDKIISPTFVLIRQHPIPKGKRMMYHVDLYRLENINIDNLGIKELFNSDGVTLIEWAEKIKDQLPQDTIYIFLDKISKDKRSITLKE